MRVDTMRKVDYWVGVPLCALLSLFFWVAKFFAGPNKDNAIRNALFIELSEMGSAILVDPAMRKLQSSTGAKLHFVIFAKNAPSLALLKTVQTEDIYKIQDDNIVVLAISSLKFLFWCRARQIDTVFDLELFSRFTSLLSALSGGTRRVGFHACHDEGLYRGSFLTHQVTYNPHIHISKNFISLIEASKMPLDKLPYVRNRIDDSDIVLARAEPSASEQAAVDKKIKALFPSHHVSDFRIVLINPNASELLPQRRWPQEYYAALVQSLLGEFSDILVVVTGAPSEKSQADILVSAIDSPRCVNSAGIFLFQELVALYSRARMMLTNDSGPGHFSAVTPLRTFVIFGPETPSLYGSLGNSQPIYAGIACSPCVSATNHRKTSCLDNQCLKVIKPDYVSGLMASELRLDSQ